MIGSLNVLDIVCYIQEAYRSAQHFVLGIRSQVSSLRRKVAKCIMRYLVLIGVLIGMYVDQRSRSYRSVMWDLCCLYFQRMNEMNEAL